MSHAELTTVTPHTQGWVGDEEEGHGHATSRRHCHPGPWGPGAGALGTVAQSWSWGGRGLPQASRSPRSWVKLWGELGGKDSQGDMVPSAVRGLVAVTRGSVVTSQTRGLGGGRRLPAHTSLRTRYRRHRTGGPWLPVPAPAAPQFLFLSARWRQSSEAPGAEQVRARLSAPCQARGGRRRPGASGPMAPRCCCFSWTRRRARCCWGHRGQSRWRRRPVREGGSCDPAGG